MNLHIIAFSLHISNVLYKSYKFYFIYMIHICKVRFTLVALLLLFVLIICLVYFIFIAFFQCLSSLSMSFKIDVFAASYGKLINSFFFFIIHLLTFRILITVNLNNLQHHQSPTTTPRPIRPVEVQLMLPCFHY